MRRANTAKDKPETTMTRFFIAGIAALLMATEAAAEDAMVLLGDDQAPQYYTFIDPGMSCLMLLDRHLKNQEDGTWLSWITKFEGQEKWQRVWNVICFGRPASSQCPPNVAEKTPESGKAC
jgi:hypothetical protein